MSKDTNKPGIYIIINKVNGKVYVGSTCNAIEKRWSKHIRNMRLGKNTIHLQNAYNKYGEENFEFLVLQNVNVEDLDYILDIETAWIRYYDSANQNKGYNIQKIGGSNRGIKLSEETKKKISRKGKEHCWYGRQHSEESKEKMSKSLTGKFKGSKNPNCKYKYEDFNEVKKMLNEGKKNIEISIKTGISPTEISKIKLGKHWSCKEVE